MFRTGPPGKRLVYCHGDELQLGGDFGTAVSAAVINERRMWTVLADIAGVV